jgi:LysM repeat protein
MAGMVHGNAAALQLAKGQNNWGSMFLKGEAITQAPVAVITFGEDGERKKRLKNSLAIGALLLTGLFSVFNSSSLPTSSGKDLSEVKTGGTSASEMDDATVPIAIKRHLLSGKTLEDLAQQACMTVEDYADYCDIPDKANLSETTRLPVPQWTHTVQKSEGLYRISVKNGLPLPALLAANGLKADAVIKQGQVLRLPLTVVTVASKADLEALCEVNHWPVNFITQLNKNNPQQGRLLVPCRSFQSSPKEKTSVPIAMAAVPSASTPKKLSRWPVDGPVVPEGKWGAARSGGRTHKGLDVYAPKYAAVVSPADAAIYNIKPVTTGQGFTVQLEFKVAGTSYVMDCWHLDPTTTKALGLKVGQKVKMGQPIGYVGESGNAEGGDGVARLNLAKTKKGKIQYYTHCHIAVRKKKANGGLESFENPTNILPASTFQSMVTVSQQLRQKG